MAAPTVYENTAADADVQGQLFAGKKFWVAQRVPSRNSFLTQIKANGGEVVPLEKKADYMIADHFRRDCPAGSISYTFIEASIKQGEIQDPENHRAGPAVGTVREAGASSRPTKGMRAAYTPEDDRILYKWVRDCEENGGLVSGNEIYKQLEAKNSRHTWQSWRDRYLKQLRDRPPSSFNVPDTTLPSPPSDEHVGPIPTPQQEKVAVSKKEEAPSSKKDSRPGNDKSKEEYTVDDFDNLFDKAEWEELYAFVEEITRVTGERYAKAWESIAEQKDKQSAEQWKQYFEKVVLPQWQRDPVSKHKQIKKKVEKRLAEEADQKSSPVKEQQVDEQKKKAEDEVGPSTPITRRPKDQRKRSDSEDVRFEQYLKQQNNGKALSAYVFYAREKKMAVWNDYPGLDHTELHALLMTQWESLSVDDKAAYFAQETADKNSNEDGIQKQSSQVSKRSREGNYADELAEGQVETPRPVKRRKSEELPPEIFEEHALVSVDGSQQQPIELSSAESSTSGSQLPQDDDMENITPVGLHVPQGAQEPGTPSVILDSDLGMDGLEAIGPPTGFEPLDSSDYPSNTPTPRAPRHKAPAFDTQAILSSPLHGFSLEALPLPEDFTQTLEENQPRDESPTFHPLSPNRDPESEASTTHSLQEFRRSLNSIPREDGPLDPLPAPNLSSSPPSPSSTDSGDPDPPLTPSEFDLYFDEQHAAGFSDELITAALKHTRCRPELAAEVLAAWKENKPLPNERGIWSAEDDEDVESGDGLALARLEKKHTCDGWGGITERMRFLETYRSREQEK